MHRPWTACLLACLALCSGGAWAQSPAPMAPITLHYFERPPFYYSTPDGQVVGLVAAPTVQAFAKAGIPITWQLTPASRTMAILKANIGADCSPGMYKTPERENFGRYTLPIYRDRPLVGLSKIDYAAPEGISARELFARPETRLMLKQDYVHGAYMDKLIAQIPPAQVQRVTDELPSMVRMIQAGFADLILTTEEEADLYMSQPRGHRTQKFRVLRFPDVPAVEQRYILCSKRVPEEVINKLNAAIGALPPEPPRPR